jgi:hypothetical protein
MVFESESFSSPLPKLRDSLKEREPKWIKNMDSLYTGSRNMDSKHTLHSYI